MSQRFLLRLPRAALRALNPLTPSAGFTRLNESCGDLAAGGTRTHA
ncbi:hypothetical protein Dcar01_03344 [Deinococcus carri]|uniref:Transposase n=1 Tax=Deinococcus carri TaxID=1211323 RepID=A0ABP9WB74_9DEIO